MIEKHHFLQLYMHEFFFVGKKWRGENSMWGCEVSSLSWHYLHQCFFMLLIWPTKRKLCDKEKPTMNTEHMHSKNLEKYNEKWQKHTLLAMSRRFFNNLKGQLIRCRSKHWNFTPLQKVEIVSRQSQHLSFVTRFEYGNLS